MKHQQNIYNYHEFNAVSAIITATNENQHSKSANNLQFVAKKFEFQPENYKYTPKYISGVWDGYIRPVTFGINRKNNPYIVFPIGLYEEIMHYLNDLNSNVSFNKDYAYDKHKQLFLDQESIDNLEFEIYNHQLQAVETALRDHRKLILSPTGSGKSLIIYLLIQSMLKNNVEGKILLLVPTVGLVKQLYKEMIDYTNGDEQLKQIIHCISAGKPKNNDKSLIYISTWQSIYKESDDYFKQFGTLIVDEVHTADCNSITKICEKTKNAYYRFGLTGTLKETKLNRLALTGYFGSVFECVNTKRLIDMNILSKLNVTHVYMNHQPTIKPPRTYLTYRDEIDIINKNEKRYQKLAILSAYTAKTKGNTLILVNYVEKQADVLNRLLNEIKTKSHEHQDLNIYYVTGKTSADEREQVRNLIENDTHGIIIATYQVYQAGVNIKNLHNVIFASPTKSIVRTLQSIGRGLRLHESKECCNLYDVVDVLNIQGHNSYTEKHYMMRKQYYKDITAEQFTLEFDL